MSEFIMGGPVATGAATSIVSGSSVTGTEPRLLFNETDQGANGKIWDIDVQGGVFSLRTRTDADGAGNAAWSVTRSGTTITSVNIPNSPLIVGTINIVATVSPFNAIWFTTPTSGNYALYGDATQVVVNTPSAHSGFLTVATASQLEWSLNLFKPTNDVALSLGDASHRFNNIFSQAHTGNAGTSTATMNMAGLVDSQVSATGIGNGSDATDDTLFTYTLPQNALNANGKAIRVTTATLGAGNGNNKTTKLWFAGTAVLSNLTSSSAEYTFIKSVITRIDSTHVSVWTEAQRSGGTVLSLVTPNLVCSDFTSNSSIIKVTGASGSSQQNDLKAYQMITEFLN